MAKVCQGIRMNNAFGQFSDEALESFKEAALDVYNFKPGGCPRGFRSKGFKTIAGERRKVCCSVRRQNLYDSRRHSAMNHINFNEVAQADFEVFDYARCQRPDGSYYGTGGQCRKGVSGRTEGKGGFEKGSGCRQQKSSASFETS